MAKGRDIYVYEDVYYLYIKSTCSHLKNEYYSIDDFISSLATGLEGDVKILIINALSKIKSGGINGSLSTLQKKLDKISSSMEYFPGYIEALNRYRDCDEEDEDKYYDRVVSRINKINNSL